MFHKSSHTSALNVVFSFQNCQPDSGMLQKFRAPCLDLMILRVYLFKAAACAQVKIYLIGSYSKDGEHLCGVQIGSPHSRCHRRPESMHCSTASTTQRWRPAAAS